MATVDLLLSVVDIQTFLAALVILFLIYYLFISSTHELPPGPNGWPIIGNELEIRKYGDDKIHLYYSDLQKKYGNVYRLYSGGHLMVIVHGHEAVRDVLVKQGGFLSYRPSLLYGPSQIVQDGKGIVWSDGEEWKQIQRLTLTALCDLGVGEISLEDRIHEELNRLMDSLSSQEGHRLNVRGYLHRAILNVKFGIIFGSRFEYDDLTFERLVDTVEKMSQSQSYMYTISLRPLNRFLPSCSKMKRCYLEKLKALSDYIQQRIEEHRTTFNNEIKRDYIDVLLKQQKEQPDSQIFSDRNIVRCIVDILIAGSETVTSTLDFALLYMIKYPDVQHKCQKEIDKITGVDRGVKLSDAPSLLYTEATIMEIQRMSAVGAFGVLRTCLRDTWIGGFRVPRGSLINTNLYSVLHDVDYWGDPHIFRPERFITPGRELLHPQALVPFGIGPRMCMGETLARMELFIFFANLIQVFHFSKADNSEPDIELVMGVTTNPKPYELILHTRC